MSGAVASPCIGVCALDRGDVCEGCNRHVDEIAAWAGMDDTARREVLRRAQQRCRERFSVHLGDH